jgi:heme oxygenase (staphylobilin-producing)
LPIDLGLRVTLAVVNSLHVEKGAADQIVERFAESRGGVQSFPAFVSMEVMRTEEGDEVLVITRWQSRASFEASVGSEEFAKAHGRGGEAGLLRSHPKVTAYEVVVERDKYYGTD